MTWALQHFQVYIDDGPVVFFSVGVEHNPLRLLNRMQSPNQWVVHRSLSSGLQSGYERDQGPGQYNGRCEVHLRCLFNTHC